MFVRKLANSLRDLFINRFNLAIALTTAAVVAKGIQNDINNVMFCLGLGIGKTLTTMTGIYYGADYRLSLSNKTLCLTPRDYCERIDPVAFYNAHSNEP